MRSIAISGDATTTTTLALASCWPTDDAVAIEMDPTGGSLAAWLGVPIAPSLSSVVAAIHRAESTTGEGRPSDHVGSRSRIIDAMIRRAPGGVRFLPCPFTAREASRATSEAAELIMRSLATDRCSGLTGPLLFDLGRRPPDALPADAVRCDTVVAVHRQESASARAAAVRLERFAETIEVLAHRRTAHDLDPPVALVVGARPFDPDEIGAHIGTDLVHALLTLADDPMAAAVLAGRAGVSERRLRR